MMTHLTSLDQTQHFAQELLGQILDKSYPPLILLSGDLGTGKTTFTQYIGQAVGVDQPITSPTYTIRNTYSTPRDDYPLLIHMDLYRLQAAW